MSNLTPGQLINDRYQLKQPLGQGSFGEVWLAYDLITKEEVAIKMYIMLDPEGLREFETETNNTSALNHPNLLLPRNAETWMGRPFLVMDYCPAGSMSKRIGMVNEETVWHFVRDVSAGLAYMHDLDEPIIHQDIKPDNILVGPDGSFKITDFGISTRVRDTMARISGKHSSQLGAQAYMAPERFSEDPTPLKASDIWALGVTIYELATGKLPFSGLGGGLLKGGAEIPHLTTNYSERLDRLVRACMQKDTWDRPNAQDLQYYAEAVLRGAQPIGTWEEDLIVEPTTPPPYIEEINNIKNTSKKSFPWFKALRVALWALMIGLAAVVLYRLVQKLTTKDPDEELVAQDIISPPQPEAVDITDQAQSETNTDDDDVTEKNSDVTTTESGESSAVNQAPAPTPAPSAPTATVQDPAAQNKTKQAPQAQQGQNVAEPQGYRGPEDSGRPQNNHVGEYDGKTKDHGVTSRHASSPNHNKAYNDDPRYQRSPGYIPEPQLGTRSTQTVPKSVARVSDTNVRTALANNDYATVKRLADSGNIHAFVPMADYCMRNGDYASAERYAKKAAAAGLSGGQRVIDLLTKMGYYD